MSYDVKCPYCGEKQNINHDDGVGYEEDEIHQQQCKGCDKYFVYTTQISYSYDVTKADCLNDGECTFRPINTFPKEYTRMVCTQCGEYRNPTEQEMVEIMKEKK